MTACFVEWKETKVMNRKQLSLLILACLVFVSPAFAQDAEDPPEASDAAATESTESEEGFYWPPRFEGELVIEVQNDYTPSSDDSDAEINNLFTTTELDLDTYFAEPFFINTHLTLEQVEDPKPGNDCYFCELGLFVESLSANWEEDRWSLIGGKFGPNFALAWDNAPGIYGTDIGEDDIELAERIGFGGSVTVIEDETFGAHTLSGSVFFADTSVLSESYGTNRGRFRLSDGGPSNTESLESFVVALDGEIAEALPGFSYQVGGARQAVDRVNDEDGERLPSSEIDDEYRFVAAGLWALELNEDTTVTPLLEYVRFWNAEGIKDEDRDYLTASTLIEYQAWNVALSYTGRFIDNPDGGDQNDTLFQVSAGYLFDFGLEADIGYRFLDEEDIESHTFGLFFVYDFDFSF